MALLTSEEFWTALESSGGRWRALEGSREHMWAVEGFEGIWRTLEGAGYGGLKALEGSGGL